MMGVARSLAWSYEIFLLFEFLDPALGTGVYTSALVLGLYYQLQFKYYTEILNLRFIAVYPSALLVTLCFELTGTGTHWSMQLVPIIQNTLTLPTINKCVSYENRIGTSTHWATFSFRCLLCVRIILVHAPRIYLTGNNAVINRTNLSPKLNKINPTKIYLTKNTAVINRRNLSPKLNKINPT
jgi:hypothetical protein